MNFHSLLRVDKSKKQAEMEAARKALEEVKNKYLSRNSEFNNLKKGMKDVPAEDRPKIGTMLNEISKTLEAGVAEKFEKFYNKFFHGIIYANYRFVI